MSARDLLPLYALGLADRDETREVEAALARDPALRAEWLALTDTSASLAEALPPVAPAPGVRARLLASIAAEPRGVVAQLAELFDLAFERARSLLSWLDEPTRWQAQTPGIELAAVAPGAKFQSATCGLLRIGPGVSFPWHGHAGEEAALVLAGGARMSDGRQVGPGDLVVSDATTEHGFTADHDGPCVFAVRTSRGARTE